MHDEPYHVRQAWLEANRERIDQRLIETWNDPNITWADLQREFGLSEDVLRQRGYRLGLGKRANRTRNAYGLIPEKPSLAAGRYAGRRYEDEPRDRQRLVPIPFGCPLGASMMGNAAAMCAEM